MRSAKELERAHSVLQAMLYMLSSSRQPHAEQHLVDDVLISMSVLSWSLEHPHQGFAMFLREVEKVLGQHGIEVVEGDPGDLMKQVAN